MNTIDLRLNNLVKNDEGTVLKVTGINKDTIYYEFTTKHGNKIQTGESSEYIEPIPLTEEILLNSDFEFDLFKEQRTYITPKSFDCGTRPRFTIEKHKIYWIPDHWTLVKLEYVHTLQNLIYILKNMEIEITL